MNTEGVIGIALDRGFTVVKESLVHGKGVFAQKIIPKGSRIIEYKGERVLKNTLAEDMANGLTSLTYVMNLNETTAIDGERNGNDARFINHSCMPNCTVYFFDDTPFIYSKEEILEGSELTFDYKLGTENHDHEMSLEQKKELFPCNCGTAACRGTLLNI